MRLLSSFCFLLLLTACGGDSATDTTATPTATPTAAESETSAPAAAETSAPAFDADPASVFTESLCFYDETPHSDGSGLADRRQMRLTILGKKVSGYYQYLPAEKDPRNGRITGTYEDNTIHAKYAFGPEGSKEVLTFDVVLSGSTAIFKGAPARASMPEKMTQVDCEDLAGQ